MLQTIKKYEEEDRSAAAKKDRHIAKSRVEVIKANKEAIESKRMHKEREKEEVEVILAYQAKQDEKMTIREDEEAEKKNPIKESRRSCRRGRGRRGDEGTRERRGVRGRERDRERKRRRGEVLEVLVEAETQTTMRSQTY